MINIDISLAVENPEEIFVIEYSGTPEILDVELKEPLQLVAEYWKSREGIVVAGHFDATVMLECTRCLEAVEHQMRYDFDELFVPEDNADDDDSYTFDGDRLSLDKLVFDAITLDLPQKVLCNETCKGLCQYCGRDLNYRSCDCDATAKKEAKKQEEEDNPFAVLKDLFDEKDDK